MKKKLIVVCDHCYRDVDINDTQILLDERVCQDCYDADERREEDEQN